MPLASMMGSPACQGRGVEDGAVALVGAFWQAGSGEEGDASEVLRASRRRLEPGMMMRVAGKL